VKKTTKGTIAIAAAITLLLGGAGSLAYWQESASIATQNVSTGQLKVSTGTGTWAVKKLGATATTPITVGSFKMVPGDTVTYTVPFSTIAEGDNLVASANVAWGAASNLPAGMTSTVGGTYNSASFTGTSFPVVKSSGTAGTLVFTLTWDIGTSGSNAGMNQTINLAATTITVAQATS